jgi:hypothetical protein
MFQISFHTVIEDAFQALVHSKGLVGYAGSTEKIRTIVVDVKKKVH